MMPHPQPPVYVESDIVCCTWMVRPWQSGWRFSFGATASGCAKGRSGLDRHAEEG